MIGLSWMLSSFIVAMILSYHRASLMVWSLTYFLILCFASIFYGIGSGLTFAWLSFIVIFGLLLIVPLRRQIISKPLLNFYRKVMPSMSRTEREAIGAGTITWEGDIFRGNPNWKQLLALPPAKLSEEEQAFLAGPVDTLCQAIDDWDITHNRCNLPPEIWDYITKEGFFALIIPKRYGGKEFSAYAHSQILTKISGRSITVSSTIAVPNSLGPAELLLHYGNEEQKNYYLPRLAQGIEIPCFALTSADAGSDASAMSDNGVVCWGEYNKKNILGIRLNFAKRYITLAPVATVIGLAFKLYDPDHLIGTVEDIGITCALIPRHTPGIQIGRRHFPMNNPFMNGPVSGKDVFIPLEWIIGGVSNAGKGWKMLMECLAAGRAISLPASTMGGAKVLAYAAGAYARIRKQFNVSISRFEGIEEPLARIGAYTYIMDAGRTFAASSIDRGEKPAVASAIVKYHVTELARKLSLDAMDIYGGKGICLGPRNYMARCYEASPISITVEGANILTRSLIIFGQGAIRCHPYVLPEIEAAEIKDPKAALEAFDRVVIKHIAFGISNFFRSFLMGLFSSRIVKAPNDKLKHYYQSGTRFSSALALFADVAMLSLGGQLKRKEGLSARLGDILSHLYLLSAVLKQYHDDGQPEESLPIVRFAAEHCLFEIQERFAELMQNFPNRILAWTLRIVIFPLGQRFSKPKDRYNHKVAQLITAPTETRSRLAEGAFITSVSNNPLAEIQDALVKTIKAEPVEKLLRESYKMGLIKGHTLSEQAQSALAKNIISAEQFDILRQAIEACNKVIAVDDFTTEELAREVPKESFSNIYAESNGTNG